MASIDSAKFVELLSALQSASNADRQQAEKLYQQAKANEPDGLLAGLLGVLANEGVQEGIKLQSAVLLRQLVSHGTEKDYVFSRAALQCKQQVADELLRRFEAERKPKVQKKIGEVVSKLAEGAYDEDDARGWITPDHAGWPALLPFVFRMANTVDTTAPASCESSIRLLTSLVESMKSEVVAAQQQLGSVLQNAFMQTDLQIRRAAFLLVCRVVSEVEKKEWAPLLATASVLNQILQQLAQANLQSELEECIQAFVEVATVEPDFFKQQLSSALEPAKFFAGLVKTREGVDNGLQKLALEWLVSYVEAKPKWLTKSLPALAPLAMECCMEMMLEIEGAAEDIEAWALRMDDEEGEEDADELFHTGEESVDRLVEVMTIDNIGTSLFALIERFASQEAWQAKHAALAAVRQAIEYVEDQEHVNAMVKLLLQHVDHQHPRVRYMSLHAIGQLSNDQAPQFQDSWHQVVMPVLLGKMDDPLDRIASMSMSAFVSFGEELDNTLMMTYTNDFMQKLVSKLQTSKHRMVQEESITSIAVIAGVIEKDFSQYYDGIMPMLKQLVIHATGEKENRLRGKAFECMSLLGIAVGKEKFLPDAQQAVEEMLKTPMEADDLQREYIKEASERICKVLKADFAPFLPHLLPRILKALKVEREDAESQPQKEVNVEDSEDDEDDEYITLTTGDGKLVKVKNSQVEELIQALQSLQSFCGDMEGAFFPWVPQIAEALLPLIAGTEELALLCDEARDAAFQTWAKLIKCARVGAMEQSQQSDLPRDLLHVFLQKTCATMKEDQDPNTLSNAADGISECLKSVGPGIFGGQQLLELVQTLFGFIDESLQRDSSTNKTKRERSAETPPELQQDEDDADAAGDEEGDCRRNLVDAIGAAMQIAPVEFLQCLPECGRRMEQWLSIREHRVLALFLGCDLIRHLKDQSETVWPVLMPAVFQCLGDTDQEVRIPAAYAVNLSAPLPHFAEAAPEAFRKLSQIVGGPAPKRRDTRGRVAFDNAVAALMMLAKDKPELCPPEVQAWPLVLGKLPLKDDEEEAKKTHVVLVELVLAQHVGLLGPELAHLGKILSVLAEIYKQEDICTTEADEKIVRIFQHLPREKLQASAGNLTEKQQKKIEKMLAAEPVLQHGG